jgi:hypothetical protein
MKTKVYVLEGSDEVTLVYPADEPGVNMTEHNHAEFVRVYNVSPVYAIDAGDKFYVFRTIPNSVSGEPLGIVTKEIGADAKNYRKLVDFCTEKLNNQAPETICVHV